MKTQTNKAQTFQKRNFYTVRDTGNVYFLALIFGLAFSLIFSLVFAQIMYGIDPKFNLQEAEGTTIYFVVQLVSSILTQAVFLCVYLCYHPIQGISYKASNLHAKKVSPWQTLLWATVGIFCVLGFLCLVEGCFGHMFSAMKIATSGEIKIASIGNYFLYVVFVALLPAIVEELLFRGVIYQGLKEYFSLPSRILLSGLLFALMHQNIVQFIYPFILGCVLSLVMEKTNNLFYTMTLHFFNNFTTITAAYIMQMYNFSFDKLPMTWWFILLSVFLALFTAGVLFLVFRFVRCKKVEVEKVGDQPQKPMFLLGKFPVLLLGGMLVALVMIVINAVL